MRSPTNPPPARSIMTAAAWVPDQRSPCSLVRDDGAIFRFKFQTADTRPHSRGTILPELCVSLSLMRRGSRECRMRAAPAVSCAKLTKENAHEHTGSAEALRHSLRNGFTAYFALSPENRALLSPSSANR